MLHLWNRTQAHGKPRHLFASGSIKPALEGLEDRTVPAAVTTGVSAEAAPLAVMAALPGQADSLVSTEPLRAQQENYQHAALAVFQGLFSQVEAAMASEFSMFQAWSIPMSGSSPGSGSGLLTAGVSAAPTLVQSTPNASPSSSSTSPTASGSTASTGAAAPVANAQSSPKPVTSHLGRFTTLATPFNATTGGTMLAAPGGVYFASGSQLWYLNESTGKWSGPWKLPTGPAIQLTLLPNGDVAAGVGVGNIDLSGGTTPSQFVVVNPKTGIVQLSDLRAGYAVSGDVMAGDGSILAVTSWSGALAGHGSSRVNEGVWASSDGVHFSLRSRVPDTGALWFLDKATDGSNRLWSGGEGPLGPFQSTDNGHSWQPLGTSNALGFKGNAWGVAELPDGTLLVQKRLITATGQYPLVRGKPGGPWLPSSSGLPTFLDVTRLDVLPTGAVIAGAQDTNSGGKPNGGAYVSYDNGNTWTSLSNDGVPSMPMNAITATSTHAYLWPQGQAPMVATL
jgi:hypothetical protein